MVQVPSLAKVLVVWNNQKKAPPQGKSGNVYQDSKNNTSNTVQYIQKTVYCTYIKNHMCNDDKLYKILYSQAILLLILTPILSFTHTHSIIMAQDQCSPQGGSDTGE